MVYQPYKMSISALLLAAAATVVVPSPPETSGAKVVQAQARAVILEPVIVRQDRGIDETRKDAPQSQRTSREGKVFYEFQ
ncbi:hypothetical protein [Altererythrobacter sp. Root672]|uniref:hypothetical protein n=1 Tax=Altererythrobacter sp. Root672 TaxID=1736584 RepID=UPI000701EB64|nr:hypothetical protein [Altererythrobacter sp. Root672]KRA80613.1 hypothetical protein ASD76_15805 [Altererythrobacter sp. Root672]